MEESQRHGMQALPLKPEGLLSRRSIDLISQQRVTDRCHVNADLMGTACFQTAFDVCETAKPLQHPVVGNRRLAVLFVDRHFLPVHRVAPDGAVDGTLIFLQVIPDDGPVAPGNRMFLQLLCQTLMCLIVFADDNGTGGIPVDPVNDFLGRMTPLIPERFPWQ